MTMESNPQAALYAALAAAQADMKNPGMTGENAAFKQGNKVSKYAKLLDVRDAVIPALARHGICVTQAAQTSLADGGKLMAGVTTTLAHKDGGSTSGTLMVPVANPNAHGVGSALTYARRFSLMAMVGVVGDDDDDGNNASGYSEPNHAPPPAQRPVAAKPATKPAGKPDEPASEGPTAAFVYDTVKQWSGLSASNDIVSAVRQCMARAGVKIGEKEKMTPGQCSQVLAWVKGQMNAGVDFMQAMGGAQ